MSQADWKVETHQKDGHWIACTWIPYTQGGQNHHVVSCAKSRVSALRDLASYVHERANVVLYLDGRRMFRLISSHAQSLNVMADEELRSPVSA